MSVRAFPMPAWPNSGKYLWCKWCGEPIPKVIDGKTSGQRMWHPACLHEYELHTRVTVQFDHLADRDGRRCACCPEGAAIPKRWQVGQWPVRMVRQPHWTSERWGDLSHFWENPCPGKPWREQTELERATGEVWDVDLVDWLEVDHRVPLWEVADLPDEERRWYFGPGNLWLLCGPHHKEKTRREATRRAWIRKLARAQLSLDL